MSVNNLEERLRVIEKQKVEYERKAKVYGEDNDMGALYDISKKIKELECEKSQILCELQRGD